jgi:hypothetical protein
LALSVRPELSGIHYTGELGPTGTSHASPLAIPSAVWHLADVAWGTVELEPEVAGWLEGLPDKQWGRVEFYIDLLAHLGTQLGEPYTRLLNGRLRELRFYLGPTETRFGSPITSPRVGGSSC